MTTDEKQADGGAFHAALGSFEGDSRADEMAVRHLSLRVLRDFDRVTTRRDAGLFARLADIVWPGASAWQPAAALASSLALGVLAGAAAGQALSYDPAAASAAPQFSLDAGSIFDAERM